MNTSRTNDVVVIGGGQAGLAMSRCLTDRSIDHVVLERAQVANSWTTERWDSLRLLTPNWMSRLPGYGYRGPDPDGYMTAGEVAAFLDTYRRSFDAPVRTGVAVTRITSAAGRHVVETTDGPWHARAVVMATGACSNPHVPAIAAEMPRHIGQLTPIAYRNPDQIGDGDVLVVGASASGLQIVDELARAGREVTLAVGEHVRLPRTYRGMDIHWWMDAIGQLDERYDEVEDLARARRLPSLQLVGSPERRTLGLDSVAAERRAPRGSPRRSRRAPRPVLRLVREHVHARPTSSSSACSTGSTSTPPTHGLDAELGPAERPAPTPVGRPALDLDLRSDRNDRLGDRLPPDLPVARRRAARHPGPTDPRRRRPSGTGHVRARPPVPPPPQVELRRRRRPRRPGALRPPVLPPRPNPCAPVTRPRSPAVRVGAGPIGASAAADSTGLRAPAGREDR